MAQVPSLGRVGRRRIGRSSRVSQIHAYDLRTKEDVLFFDESEISVNKSVTCQTRFKDKILYSEIDDGEYAWLIELRY